MRNSNIQAMSRHVKKWWENLVKNFGGKCSVENIVGNFLVESYGGNAIFDILEPTTFHKCSIQWVLEAFYIFLCLCPCVFVFVFLFL